MKRLIEIRTYRLKPGKAGDFRAIMSQQAMPMLIEGGTDVVAFGRSEHEEETYFLIRAYADHADLIARQDAFYGSPEWRKGPREAVIGCIDTYLNTLLWLTPEGVENLRGLNADS
jgi:quinol monooxygenase YgiN